MRTSGISLVLLSILLLFNVQAQEQAPAAATVPVDSITKLITYEGVITTPGVKADRVFKRAVSWFNTFYTNPAEVIRENDSITMKIIGKPRFRISNIPDKDGAKSDIGLVQYTITVAVREGRYKYELTSFNWKQSSYFACEKWLDKKHINAAVHTHYLNQLDAEAREVIKNLKTAMMADAPVKDKDKW